MCIKLKKNSVKTFICFVLANLSSLPIVPTSQETLGGIVFENHRMNLEIHTSKIVQTEGLVFDFKSPKVGIDSIKVPGINFKIIKANYTENQKLGFDIGLGSKIIYFNYKGRPRILTLKNSFKFKFYGFRKTKNELNLYFCLKGNDAKIEYFAMRYGENETKIILNRFDHLPSIERVRNFCYSDKYWNDFSMKP